MFLKINTRLEKNWEFHFLILDSTTLFNLDFFFFPPLICYYIIIKMKSLTLSYLNSSLEEKYQQEILKQAVKKLTLFCLLENLIAVSFQIPILIRGQSTLLTYIIIPLMACLTFIILLLKKKSSPFLIIVLRLNFVCHTILIIEMICFFDGLSNSISLAMMISFQIMQSMLIYIKSKWIHTSMFYFASLLYLFFRNEQMESQESFSVPTIILIFFFSWIFHSCIAFDQERIFKEFYKNMMDSYEKVNYFQLILKNVIPLPIFIIDYERSRIKFANSSGRKLTNSKKINESENLFENFEKFIHRLNIIKESSDLTEIIRPITDDNNQELKIILKNYYYDPKKQPFKAHTINEKDLEKGFQIINVWMKSPLGENEIFNDNDFHQKEPQKKYYEIKIVKVFWEDSICLLLLLNDNTNVFRISELLNLDHCKNQLLASVSHDLRTPLNGLNGMLEISISKTDDPILKNYLDLAKKSGSFLNYLVNDILDFSLMSFKKMRLNIEEINIRKIIEEMMSLIEFQTRDKKLDLEFICECKETRPIFSDNTRIQQVLLNLLSNAIKFTHQGSIKVILENFPDTLDERSIYKISVEDTGIGIQQEDVCKLFRLFGRLNDQKKINKTGIGLGLTISKNISKLLCPEKPEGLQIESIFGKGSTFSFFLSSLKPPETNVDIIKNETSLQEQQINFLQLDSPLRCFTEESVRLKTGSDSFLLKRLLLTKKILVVDDDLMNLMIAEQYLKLFNIKSIRAVNGLEAYQVIKQDLKSKKNEICMVLMDCNMPIMDGLQASVKIQKYCKKVGRSKMPILAVTANTTAADALLSKNSGMDYFLEKPMKKADLKNMIETILNEKIIE